MYVQIIHRWDFITHDTVIKKNGADCRAIVVADGGSDMRLQGTCAPALPSPEWLGLIFGSYAEVINTKITINFAENENNI
jgi:hypothetical protein